MLRRREFLSLPAAALAQSQPPAAQRPNVVILLADDLGWADVGFHNSEIETPSLNSLAKESVEVDRFYSCPLCSPTRSALMTGRYPMRLGLGYTVVRPWANTGLPLDEHLMPQTFLAAGYQTAMAGKWHLGHARRAYFPGSRGFQSSYGHFNGAIDYYKHEREGGLDWHRNGKTLDEQGYSTELIGAEAVRRIRERDKSKPLMLYVPFNAPHSPLQAPPALIDKYARVADPTRRTFAAMVDAMDTQVGRILKTLDEQQMADNTVVVFFSDNGGPVRLGARNTPLRGAKGSTWEGGTRVPALIRWPGRLRPGLSRQVMMATDLFPTLAGACGVPVRATKPLDGKNVWNSLLNGRPVPREDIFLSIESTGKLHCAVHTGEWKLVQETGKGGGTDNHLFRIAEDPTESRDWATKEPKIVAELTRKAADFGKLEPHGGLRHTERPPTGWKAPRRWADEAAP